MKAGKIICMFLLFLAAVGPSVLYAETAEFDKAMQPILEEYLKIQEALAGDKTEGVKRATELIVILADNTECLHCQEAVPELNMLAEATDLPPVIALWTNEESQRRKFVEEFQPVFAIGQVSEDVFWRLLAEGDVPRVILVRDGHIQQVWDQTVPDKDTIKAEYPLSKPEGTLEGESWGSRGS